MKAQDSVHRSLLTPISFIERAALVKTSTGKIQKCVSREREWQGLDKRIKGV